MELHISFHPAVMTVAALVVGMLLWLRRRADDRDEKRDEKLERLQARLSHYEDVL